MKDKKKRKKDKKRARKAGWNTRDIDFDSSGRLVIKNAALARRVADTLTRNSGIVVHMVRKTYDDRTEDEEPYDESNHQIVYPNNPCFARIIDPPLNKTGCVDGQCGIAILRLIFPVDPGDGRTDPAERRDRRLSASDARSDDHGRA
jgi:hypothetical protein